MVHECIVPSCGEFQKSVGEKFSYYNLPQDPVRRKRWCEILNLNENDSRKDLRVCGRHFPSKFAKRRRLGFDVLPVAKDKSSHNNQSLATDSSNRASTSTSRDVIVVDDFSPTACRKAYPPFVSPGFKFSQASSKSAASNKESSFSYDSPLPERILENFFTSQNPAKPKKNFLEKDDRRNFIVNEMQLRLLLRHCSTCGSDCGPAFANGFGVDTDFYVDCRKCEKLVYWSTQPRLPTCELRKGNLDTTASVLLAGSTFEDLNSIATNLNLKIMSKPTFYNYAKEYVYPVVDEAFAIDQTNLLKEIQHHQEANRESKLSLAVDCRFSRPGYTATYGVTSAMCVDEGNWFGKIIGTVIKSKSDSDVASSSAMETVGTRAVLKAIMDPFTEDHEPLAFITKKKSERDGMTASMNTTTDSPDFNLPAPDSNIPAIPLRVGLLITDENSSVIAMVRKEFDLKHEADPWHLKKSIMKKISKVAEKKTNAILSRWIPSIGKWLWTAMEKCRGDPDLLVELWRSIGWHIIGRHSWEDDETFMKFKKCAHGDISRANIAFLPKESEAYVGLMEIVESKKIHKRLRRCTSFMHTSCLESFHSLLCKYVPKDLRFSGTAFETRTRMAILDWNENVGRPIRRDENGAEVIRFEHPAGVNDWRARRVLVDRTFRWSENILKDLAKTATASWTSGKVIRRSKPLTTHLPLVSMYEPLDRIAAAAQLYR